MTIKQRFRAAWSAFRGKSATLARTTAYLDDLLDALGIDRGMDADAMCDAVYNACVKVLAETLGKLPLKIQQTTPDKGVRIAREHPYYSMLNERPNRYMTATVFWALMERMRADRGNAYAWIDTRRPEHPQLWPIDPGTVSVWWDDGCRLADVPDVYYQVSTPSGVMVMGSEDVLHVPWSHTEDGITGVPVRESLRDTITGNLEAQRYLNRLYSSGFSAKAVLQYTGGLDDSKVESLIRGMEAYASGELAGKGIENIIPVPVGMTLTPLNLKLADSQFLESKQYAALQIASAFGVKPYQVGDYTKSSYASAEAQQLSFLVDTLLYIVKSYEEEIGYKLLTEEEHAKGYHVKFNTGVLLRADQQTQISALVSAVSNFLMTPDEARERLDLPHLPGGDQLLGNGSTIPLTDIGKQYTEKPEGEEKPEEDKPPEDTPPDDDGDNKPPEDTPSDDDQQPEKADDHKASLRKGGKTHEEQSQRPRPRRARKGSASGTADGDGS